MSAIDSAAEESRKDMLAFDLNIEIVPCVNFLRA
jgi:hypothetical protein